MTVIHLWNRRERPARLSRRWFIVWLKRLVTAPALVRLITYRAWLQARGTPVGTLGVIERCRLEGNRRNLSVGAGSFVGAGSVFALHDRITIGSRVVINRNVTILTASHSLRDPQWRSFHRPVVIQDYAWIATGATLLPGVTIGRGAVVGAGAVIRENVPDYALAVGNPAVVSLDRRCTVLGYEPTALAAPFEAWLGETIPGAGT